MHEMTGEEFKQHLALCGKTAVQSSRKRRRHSCCRQKRLIEKAPAISEVSRPRDPAIADVRSGNHFGISILGGPIRPRSNPS